MKKAYLANQFGFSETGRFILNEMFKKKWENIGIEILDPFAECAKEIDFSVLEEDLPNCWHMHYWSKFNDKVTPINNKLMWRSDCLVALLDGGHSIDDGVASEIGYYAGARPGCPIFALRTDLRLCENMALTINAQVYGYIKMSGGGFFTGPDATQKFYARLTEFANGLSKKEKETAATKS